ncbi:MAG: phospho-N-acetylmuramoyl-pentapeptide-transferase [Clostridiales Family XIII bacterium]|nr:phospho-N-acetylmuramoyl-pentapeptide-transferase [Clostridiales Family XIII bacterium]
MLIKNLIPYLKSKNVGQPIHEDVKLHQKKVGTPTMGGIAIVISVLLSSIFGIILISSFEKNFEVKKTIVLIITISLIIFVLTSLLGFSDDIKKILRSKNKGLSGVQKIIIQILIAIIFLIFYMTVLDGNTSIIIPFINKSVDFKFFYYIYIVFIFLAVINSVNLTDGMDGLLSSVTIFFSVFFVLMQIVIKNFSANGISTIIIFVSLIGSLTGFLIFNKFPAKIFMGDTGSLAIGALLSAILAISKLELYIPIIGFIYLLEAISVILQVSYFKFTKGKRIFKMAPLHHHFELSGLKEKNVAMLFAGITVFISILAFIIISIRYN